MLSKEVIIQADTVLASSLTMILGNFSFPEFKTMPHDVIILSWKNFVIKILYYVQSDKFL